MNNKYTKKHNLAQNQRNTKATMKHNCHLSNWKICFLIHIGFSEMQTLQQLT